MFRLSGFSLPKLLKLLFDSRSANAKLSDAAIASTTVTTRMHQTMVPSIACGRISIIAGRQSRLVRIAPLFTRSVRMIAGGGGGMDGTSAAEAAAEFPTSPVGATTSETSPITTMTITKGLIPDLPTLYDIPTPQLSPTYRPVPVVTRLAIANVVLLLWLVRKCPRRILTLLRLLPKAATGIGPLLWLEQVRVRAMLSAVAAAAAPSSSSALPWRTMVRCFLLRILWSTVIWQWIIPIVAIYYLAVIVCQDVWYAPSRIDTATLEKNYTLPSTLSQYRPLQVVDKIGPNSSFTSTTTMIGVHWLEYHHNTSFALPPTEIDTANKPNNDNSTLTTPISAIYLNHGFGASSLSWLPAMIPLSNALPCRTVLAHDAVGFGWTDRPMTVRNNNNNNNNNNIHNNNNKRSSSNISPYSWIFSSRIATTLLQQALGQQQHQQQQEQLRCDPSQSKTSPHIVVLMGHSMGAITTLRMALQLDPTIRQHIILVSPALGIRSNMRMTSSKKKAKTKMSKLKVYANRCLSSCHNRWLRTFLGIWNQQIQTTIDVVATYGLRRLIGTTGFWRYGLRSVWGQPDRVTSTDVLRFQWPGIAMGWERGLLAFARQARTAGADNSNNNNENEENDANEFFLSDDALVERVLALPHVTMDVIVSARDKVVPPARVRAFFQSNMAAFQAQHGQIVEMPELGHDPFEEDVVAFVTIVQELLAARSPSLT